jgi:hypothetical protein
MAVSVTGKTMLPVINSTKDCPFAAIEPLRMCFFNAYLRSLNAHMTVVPFYDDLTDDKSGCF